MDKFTKILVFLLLINSLFTEMSGQENKTYTDMTLDELLDIDVIVTASKKPEDFFETPLSTTIISKEEIESSGVTSIPEALRLSQGVIVREITPGNYDVHIRGYDDITKNVYLNLPYNTTTLVMIDNRIVYSYFSGGTLWENFPIDLIDVERIEIVRGPASALYGANAVTGVINIITSHANKEGMNVMAKVITGTQGFKNANVSVGHNWNDKTKISFSANATERSRFEKEYYNFNTKKYTSNEDLSLFIKLVKNPSTNEIWTYKDYMKQVDIQYEEEISLKRLGGNVFFQHNFSEVTNVDIAMGAQQSQSQKSGLLNMVTPLSQFEAYSYYLDTKIKHKDFCGQFNFNSGQDLSNYKFGSNKYTNVDVNMEYSKQFGNISVRPGLGYKYLNYNSPFTYDEPYDLNLFNNQSNEVKRVSSSYSAFVLSEWKPTQNLRIIGAARVDKFDMNKNYFTNFETATTYRVNKNNLIRISYSKANKSPFFFDSYLNTKLSTLFNYEIPGTNASVQIPATLTVKGQEDLKYPTITNLEIGWRTKINSNLNLDVEMFYSKVNNFVNANIYNQFTIVQHVDNMGKVDGLVNVQVNSEGIFENYDLTANQLGAGFTLNYEFSDKLNAKLYGTVQNTKIAGRTNIENNVTSIEISPVSAQSTVTNVTKIKVNPTQWTEKLTPKIYGGFLVNYKLNKKWNLSSDAYFYGKQEFAFYNYYNLLDANSSAESKVAMDINPNLILNAKATYQLNGRLNTFVSLKNMLGDHSEYGFADQISRQFLIGLTFDLK